MKLKKLYLKNFCNYKEHTFYFYNGCNVYPFACFFGPNGIGKSTALEAISMLFSNFTNQEPDRIKMSLSKFVRNTDYDPTYHAIAPSSVAENTMIVEGTFADSGGSEYIVSLGNHGFTRDDLSDPVKSPWKDNINTYKSRIMYFLKSDSDLSLSKFQLCSEQVDAFEDICCTVMGYKVKAKGIPGLLEQENGYFTDCVIEKSGYNIHYKRMSAGEKKIVKSCSQLLNAVADMKNANLAGVDLNNYPCILLIDNVEMHIYYTRHIAMIDCLKRHFPNQQILATTHSGVLIERSRRCENDRNTEIFFDVESING